MTDLRQELMTPPEAAKWFRRSPSWLRQQPELLRIQGVGGQPLYHVSVCRAYVLGRLCRLTGGPLRRLQIRALVTACGLGGARGPLPAPVQVGDRLSAEIEKLLVTPAARRDAG
ncbi:MAG TPA: hypothetical protein VM487_11005 [Phycisphaerae bacterium]|nr:hypothetical protein [Phycisphaerae bacterium]